MEKGFKKRTEGTDGQNSVDFNIDYCKFWQSTCYNLMSFFCNESKGISGHLGMNHFASTLTAHNYNQQNLVS